MPEDAEKLPPPEHPTPVDIISELNAEQFKLAVDISDENLVKACSQLLDDVSLDNTEIIALRSNITDTEF